MIEEDREFGGEAMAARARRDQRVAGSHEEALKEIASLQSDLDAAEEERDELAEHAGEVRDALAAALAALRELHASVANYRGGMAPQRRANALAESARILAEHEPPPKTREEKLRDVYGPEAFDAADPMGDWRQGAINQICTRDEPEEPGQ